MAVQSYASAAALRSIDSPFSQVVLKSYSLYDFVVAILTIQLLIIHISKQLYSTRIPQIIRRYKVTLDVTPSEVYLESRVIETLVGGGGRGVLVEMPISELTDFYVTVREYFFDTSYRRPFSKGT